MLSLFWRFLSKLIRDRWQAMCQIQNGSRGAQNEVRGLEAGEQVQMKCRRARRDKAAMGVVRPSDSLSQADLETMQGAWENRRINRDNHHTHTRTERKKAGDTKSSINTSVVTQLHFTANF